MGAYARYPIALAPGMGLNAYFTYTVVKGMGIPWQTALGAVFLSGVAFFILTLTGLRQLIDLGRQQAHVVGKPHQGVIGGDIGDDGAKCCDGAFELTDGRRVVAGA